MTRITLSNYLAPVCRTVLVRASRPLATSEHDTNQLNFGEDDAAGGRINNGDIYDFHL